MKEFYKNYLKDNTFFWLFSIIGLLLIVIAFFIPPAAQIHQSVLIAVGEIDGLIAIGAVLKAIDNGGSATFQHNGTELTINSNEDKQEDE